MGADTQSLRNFLNWIPPHRNLMHRILFEIVTKSCIAQGGLLASFLGKKVSTNLGAIQTLFFLPSAIGPLSIPAVKPNSLHRLFTSLSALLRSFAGRSSLHGRLQSLLSYLFVNALIISISPQRNEGRAYLTLTRSNSNAFG
jgi:hypothetical protein